MYVLSHIAVYVKWLEGLNFPYCLKAVAFSSEIKYPAPAAANINSPCKLHKKWEEIRWMFEGGEKRGQVPGGRRMEYREKQPSVHSVVFIQQCALSLHTEMCCVPLWCSLQCALNNLLCATVLCMVFNVHCATGVSITTFRRCVNFLYYCLLRSLCWVKLWNGD